MNFLNKLAYNLKCAIIDFRKKTINLLIIISLASGLLFPIIVMSYGNMIFKFFNEEDLINDYNRVILLRLQNDLSRKVDIEKILNNSNDIELYSKNSSMQQIVWGNNVYDTTLINFIDNNYMDFYRIDVKKGVSFNNDTLINSINKCIVGSKIQEKFFKKYSNRNKITIFGSEFEVIGITNSIKYINNIIIPLSSMRNMELECEYLLYYVKFKENINVPRKVAELQDALLGKSIYNASITIVSDNVKKDKENALLMLSAFFIIALLVLVYSLANIVNIIFSKMTEERRTIGIKLALGASNTDIFLQNLFQMLILVITAAAIVFILMPVISYFFRELLYDIIKFDMTVIVISIAMCIIISVLIEIFLIFKIIKLNIIEVLTSR